MNGRSSDSRSRVHTVGTSSPADITQPLSALLESVDSPVGRTRLASYLEQQPFPHYQPHPSQADIFERIDQDGTRTVGRFINRNFERA
jgi:hypothetical protein